jgi:hypothetical protein
VIFVLTAFQVLVLAYLPGALLFRLPFGARDSRAALPADERVFWSAALSLALTITVGLILAIGGVYDLHRLFTVDLVVGAVAIVVLAGTGRGRLGPTAARPTLSVVLPLILVATAWWINFTVPPAEYVIGGRDPGIYVNEGVRIAQRGGVREADEVVSTLPPAYWDLFFPRTTEHGYYSNRFMGFFLLDPRHGTTVGQFPPGFPLCVAIGYDLNGLSGARTVPAVCGVLGVLAVYFAGARLLGRAAGFSASLLLSLNVAQVWYARYPAAEILLQPIVFTAVLAYTRAVSDGDRFFSPVSALFLVLGAFVHLTGAMAIGVIGAAAVIGQVAFGARVPLSFWSVLVPGTTLAGVYLWRFIPPYFDVPVGFIQNLTPVHLSGIAAGSIAAVAGLFALCRVPSESRVRTAAILLTTIVSLLAGYALLLRRGGGALAIHDAESLRTFTAFYLSPYALAAALIGFALLSASFTETSPFLLLIAAFSAFFFFKIRIVPEHFWAARRFLAVILPGALLLAAAAAFDFRQLPRTAAFAWMTGPRTRTARAVFGVVLVLVVGWRYAAATRPVLRHVEYAGVIPHLEALASIFGDDDLVLVESRNASDAHVLGLPLAYIYARNLLVFASPDPPKAEFSAFLRWALGRYKHVFFVGGAGGGTELLSRSMTVNAVRGERFQAPEYESAANSYPTGVKQKEFDLSVYEFLPVTSEGDEISLDIGAADDLYVRRFYAKEKSPAGFTFRWTRDQSYVSLVGMRPEQRTVTLWMGTGGRPPGAPAATIDIWLDDRQIGSATVGSGIEPYRFAIPPAAAERLGHSDAAAQLRIDTATWNPARTIGAGDTRDLGVMLDRINVQ